MEILADMDFNIPTFFLDGKIRLDLECRSVCRLLLMLDEDQENSKHGYNYSTFLHDVLLRDRSYIYIEPCVVMILVVYRW